MKRVRILVADDDPTLKPLCVQLLKPPERYDFFCGH